MWGILVIYFFGDVGLLAVVVFFCLDFFGEVQFSFIDGAFK